MQISHESCKSLTVLTKELNKQKRQESGDLLDISVALVPLGKVSQSWKIKEPGDTSPEPNK